MTALNPATDIPSEINTVEALVAWGCFLLSTINPDKAILETINQAEFVAQSGIVKAADQSNRLVQRVSIELNPAYAYDNSKKLWMHVEEYSNVAIPAGFKTN